MQKLIVMDTEIGPHAVRAQVARILGSEGFVRCRRMQRFLEFVVEETLAGRAGQLGEYAIGVSVFDRGEDFEPALDPIVRNDARRLRQKLAEYYRAPAAAKDRVFIDIPKGGYVPVFEPVSQGIERPASESDPLCRLAVLPFETIAMEPENGKLGRALCLSLTASFTGLDGVEAIAHGYVQQGAMREAARELKASHVIQGSVVKCKDRVRVIVNLVAADDGTQLWAHRFDFDESAAPEAEPEVVRTVCSEVAARLAPPRRQALRLAAAA